MPVPSPPSSPASPNVSPPSSPNSEPQSPCAKRRRWTVFNSSDKVSEVTLWRWGQAQSQEVCDQNTVDQSHNNVSSALEDPVEDIVVDINQENTTLQDNDVNVLDDPALLQDLPEEAWLCPVYVFDDDSESYFSSDGSVFSDSSCDTSVHVNNWSDVEASDSSHEESFHESDSDSDNEYLKVYEGSDLSLDEAVLDLFTDSIRNCETKKSLSDHLRTFLKFLPKNNNVPKTFNQLLKYVERLVPGYKEISFSYCSKCLLQTDNDGPCPACEGLERNSFYMFSLRDQLKFFFENCDLANVLDSARNERILDGNIRDVVDGTEYLRVKVDEEYSVTLMMNTDGVSISKSSSTRIWPIMFVICEVPPHLRQRFLIMSGVWCDQVDPPMNTLLKPIVETVLNIQQEGGVLWKHPQTFNEQKSTVRVSCVVADAPARAKVQNILGHTGNQGCNTCEQSMQQLPLTQEERRARENGVRVRCKRAYLYQEIPARLRTNARMKLQASQAYHTSTIVEGVKGPSWISRLPKLNVSRCVLAEYMHGTCLGAARHFLQVWINVPGPWNLSEWVDEIDRLMTSICPPSNICRLPRGISDHKHWKASEFRHWLLFYSLVCISGKLPDQYVQHWSLLVASIFLLLKEEISQEDLDKAEEMLNQFVKNVSVLYRDRDNVYNVHQLCHLPLYVKWWGPLWSTSAFLFESYNGYLGGLIHGTKNRGKELMKNIRIAHGVQILKTRVENRCNPNFNRNFELLSIVKNASLEADAEFLHSKGIHVHTIMDIFARAKRGRYVLTSKLYTREKKRGNFTVKYKLCNRTGYADIKYFLCHNGTNIAVVDRLRINHAATFFIDSVAYCLTHIVPVEREPMETVVLTLDDIVTKVTRVGDFICLSPNRYETNL